MGREPPTLHKTRKPSKTPTIISLATTTHATPPEIAGAVKVSRQSVYEVLRRYKIKPNTLESYKTHRADLLMAAQEKDLKEYLSLTSEERKKHVQKRGLVDMGILYDKERLERDLSTQNIKPMVFFGETEPIDITPEDMDVSECPTSDLKGKVDTKV